MLEETQSSSDESRNRKVYQAQLAYVTSHIEHGHAGYCYAWLDDGFCPSSFVAGNCCYLHHYPSHWSFLKRDVHRRKLNYMRRLWKGVDFCTFVRDCTSLAASDFLLVHR